MQNEFENLVDGIHKCDACSFHDQSFKPLAPAFVSKSVRIMFVGENPSWAADIGEPLSENTISGGRSINIT